MLTCFVVIVVVVVIDLNVFSSYFQQYATGLTAHVIGKPSAAFFTSALKELGVEPQNVCKDYYVFLSLCVLFLQALMVGDDVVNDVGGAQQCGLAGVLVRTGKYR